eukprot:GHVO01014323.1.p1 GENE.GHVO01014323.1~~GHVO01014323.1.p1  ORF type:complete len:641 (+),score=160.91 GHVO01014323.1:169-1923(+)
MGESERALKDLEGLGDRVRDVIREGVRLPVMEGALETARKTLSPLQSEYDSLAISIDEVSAHIDTCGGILTVAAESRMKANEVAEAEREYDTLKSKSTINSLPSLEVIRGRVRECNNSIHACDTDYKDIEDAKNLMLRRREEEMEELRVLETRRGDIARRILESETSMANVPNMILRRVEMEGKIGNRKKIYDESMNEMNTLRTQNEKLQQGKYQCVSGHDIFLKNSNDLKTEIRRVLEGIQSTREGIEGGSGTAEIIRELDDVIRDTTQSLEGHIQAGRLKREELTQLHTWMRDVDKNLLLKSKIRNRDNLVAEVSKLRAERGGIDPTNLRRKLEKAEEHLHTLRASKSRREGELTSTNEWRKRICDEMGSSQLRGIDGTYRDAVIHAETLNMAVADLQKYHSALERALMKYHTLKMTEINRSMKDLWQSIYRNSDIDYIAIRSDTDQDQPTTGQRSYNYRVVLVRDGIELDMKGRCSAGQKILASLIIRLALAESFCTNCGILALDEPTTNLDKANIEGLAQSLSDLIESKKAHSNFQLILITHDHEFVRALSRHDHANHFFNISKDSKGYSVIKKVDLRGF